MVSPEPDTGELVERAKRGDDAAVENLLARHRERLRHMVAVRLDDRLSGRIDPSDVVQEALTVASMRLSEYLRDPSFPFYPWLRRIAWERLVDLHRRHIYASKRSVCREDPFRLSDTSTMQLADRLLPADSGPLKQLMRDELHGRVRAAMDRLDADDREILLLRHVEGLNTRESAAVLEASEDATVQRHVRALRRLRRLLRYGSDTRE